MNKKGSDEMSVAAVVVTYNRRELLFKQIEMVVNTQTYKVDEYYIIDNASTDDTQRSVESYAEACPIKITYCKLPENIGGAGGFNYGMKKAYQDGHDWIILMDDDGRPYDELCFENMFNYISNHMVNPEEMYLINSLVLFNEKVLSFGLDHIDDRDRITTLSEDGKTIQNLVNPFNGAFVSKGLIRAIGFPNKDFFIKGDEYDFTRRSIAAHAHVFTVLESRYFHPKVLESKNKKIMGRMVHVHIEAPWKEYYTIRNYVYSSCQLKQPIDGLLYLFLRIYCVFNCKCKKIETLKMIIKGYSDGKKGVLGPVIRP